MPLNIYEFGDKLLQTNDLDPVYVGLYQAQLDRDQLARWLMAYWCFYHVGAASWLSSFKGESYWREMSCAAENVILSPTGDRWPRAAERRHFRGQKCVDAIKWLSGISAEKRISELECCNNYKELINMVECWPMFGKWIGFKIADMMERVWGHEIFFTKDICMIYDEPKQSLIAQASHFEMSKEAMLDKLLFYFSRCDAPPRYDRPCNVQEVETILCKYKGYLHGHYTIGKDIKDQRAALVGWGTTADKLLAVYPENVI